MINMCKCGGLECDFKKDMTVYLVFMQMGFSLSCPALLRAY